MLGNLLTRREASKQLRVSVWTVDRLIQAGDLRAIKVGRSVRISEDSLHNMVQGDAASAASVDDNQPKEAIGA